MTLKQQNRDGGRKEQLENDWSRFLYAFRLNSTAAWRLCLPFAWKLKSLLSVALHLIFYCEKWWKCGVFTSWDLMAPSAQSKCMKRLCNDRDIWKKTDPRELKTETPALRLELLSPQRCSLTEVSVSGFAAAVLHQQHSSEGPIWQEKWKPAQRGLVHGGQNCQRKSPHMPPPVPPECTAEIVGGEMGGRLFVLVIVCVCLLEWERGCKVGICLIPLGAGSSDRQLRPHLLPGWTVAWWLSAENLLWPRLFFLSYPIPHKLGFYYSVFLCTFWSDTSERVMRTPNPLIFTLTWRWERVDV